NRRPAKYAPVSAAHTSRKANSSQRPSSDSALRSCRAMPVAASRVTPMNALMTPGSTGRRTNQSGISSHRMTAASSSHPPMAKNPANTAPGRTTVAAVNSHCKGRGIAQSAKYSSPSSSTTASTATSNSGSGANRMMPSASGSRIKAVRTRCLSTRTAPVDRHGHRAEAALSLGVPGERRVELLGIEVRPQAVAEIKLAVGEVPEQEVAHPRLAAGADEEVRVRRIAKREIAAEGLRGDGMCGQFAALHFQRQPACGLGDIPAAAVGHGEVEIHALAVRGRRFRIRHRLAQGGRQPGKVADEAQADVVLQQLPHLPLQGQRQQAEKLLHFLGRALPVLAGKG